MRDIRQRKGALIGVCLRGKGGAGEADGVRGKKTGVSWRVQRRLGGGGTRKRPRTFIDLRINNS